MTWGELLELCRDYDCNICEDIVDDDQLDEHVDSDINGTDYGWRALRDYLSDIPTGYDYYRCDGSFDYAGMDDSDFDYYKEQVLDWMDEDSLWDDEDDDEAYDPDADLFSPGEEEEPEEPPVEEEDFSVSDLMGMCGAELVTIRQATERQRVAEEEALGDMSLLFAV